jgi:hypothetical protein
MSDMAYQDELPALPFVTLRLVMDLRNQRTSRIYDGQAAVAGLGHDGPCHAMGAEDSWSPRRDIGQFVNEARALGL